MFRVGPTAGIGNILIYISQLDERVLVSRSHLEAGYRGKYLEFTNLNLVDDSGDVPDMETPPIYINDYTTRLVHPKCTLKMRPRPLLSEELDKYRHLNFSIGLAIRLGGMNSVDYPRVADNHALEIFDKIITNTTGLIFIAVDSLDYKKELDVKFPGKLFFIDKPLVVADSNNTADDSLPFLEFFLLSRCPYVYITGGNQDFSCFSTFGYMAAVYGSRPFSIVWNAK
jgi:hypothetical protein